MFRNRYRNLRRLQEIRKVELGEDLDSGVDGGEVVEFDNVGVSQADAASAGGLADEVFAIGAVDVDVAVFAGAVMVFISVEPEDAGEDEVLFFDGVGRFPDTAGRFAANKVGAGIGVVADLLADAVPAEGSFIAVGFGAYPFFGGGDRERAGDGAVVGNDVEFLSGDGNAEVRHLF